ncbi:MAG: hypothetical protein KDA87_26960, partial [Planctomycetales bacterium]|nr:hypothetical protein [Planctomycetales bacterium]
MNEATLIDVFRDIPRTDSIRVAIQVGKLRKACFGDQTLENFLGDSLDILLRLFNAHAGAFWFRPFNAATLCPVSRIGFDQLSLSSPKLQACENLVRGAWQAIDPQIRPLDPPLVSLIGPIRDGSNSIGALQLVADCDPIEPESAKPIYARALAAALALLQPAIYRRMQVGETSIR